MLGRNHVSTAEYSWRMTIGGQRRRRRDLAGQLKLPVEIRNLEMCGKAQREPARHSVVFQCENFGWLSKTRQPFSAVSGPKFTQFGGMKGNPCRLTNLFPIVDIMLHWRDMFGQSSKSVPKTVLFLPQARGSKCPGEFGRDFWHQETKIPWLNVPWNCQDASSMFLIYKWLSNGWKEFHFGGNARGNIAFYGERQSKN